MTDYDQFGYPYKSITTPEVFVSECGSADLRCWAKDIEALQQHAYLNSTNNGGKQLSWGEAKKFAEKVSFLWHTKKSND